ncbi:MAG TPA: diacylglycerol kinase family protein [Thermotogota bacterium]|nr:diacylglycerol kinase family protein [Thermotogota bacterium]
MKVGLLANQGAGRYRLVPEAVRRYREAFPEHALYAPEGRFSPGALVGVSSIISGASNSKSYLEALSDAVSLLVQERCDRLVAFGGDGFFTNICAALIAEARPIPFMGIGTGTANVGVLSQFSPEDLTRGLPIDQTDQISPLAIYRDGQAIGYAFHDIVIGDTFLGTFDGATRNLSAEKWMTDRALLPEQPKPLSFTQDFRICRCAEQLSLKLSPIAQIIISPIYRGIGFSGKAITGLLCFSPYYPGCFCMVLADRILVEMSSAFPDYGCEIEQYLFQKGESLIMEGLSPGRFIIADGNPLCEASGSVRISRSEKRVPIIVNLLRSQRF